MQINGVNSFSNAQAFRGAEGEDKKVNKKAVIAAGVGAAAVIGAAVAAGLRGKAVLDHPNFVGPHQEKGLKKAVKCVRMGFGEALEVVTRKGSELIEQLKDKFAKKVPEAEQAAKPHFTIG